MSSAILTTKQIAAELRISDKTVRRWHEDGTLKGSWQAKKGSPIKMAAEDVDRIKKGVR